MTFLPIADRELRVAARRRSTYYIRAVTALIALLVGGFILIMELLSRSLGVSSGLAVGKMLFYVLSWYLFLICMLAGVFLASDCLSVERREGTLGFLFLTDLKGYDIVLGKLLAVSLNAFYGLLAVFPIFGLSLALGGITGGEFARTCLALTNALWFSITAALWARSELSHRAMIQTLLLLVLLVVIVPAFAARFSDLGWVSLVCSVSPYEPFYHAQAANYPRGAGNFWSSLAMSNLAGWGFLGLASWGLPRFLEAGAAGQKPNTWRGLLAGDLSLGRKQRRRGLLEINPVLWLLDDSRGLRWMIWGLCIVGSGLQFACIGAMGAVVAPYGAWPFYFLLKVLFAIQACRFFGEARRAGTLELLCTTPIADKTIYAGLWLSLRRLFLWPVVVLMSVEALCLLLSLSQTGMKGNAVMITLSIIYGVPWQLATSIADFFALGWFGLWLSLTGKKPQSAAGLTILFVLVLPFVARCVPTLLIDAVFIAVCASRLSPDFRKLVPGSDRAAR